MSKHDEKPLKISITLPRKYTERLLITILLFSHLISFDVGSLGLSKDEYQAQPKSCVIDKSSQGVDTVKMLYVDSG
jgi:hypothetical protein